MRATPIALTCAALALAGCTTTDGGTAEGPPAADRPAGQCDAAPAQSLVGEQASAELGQRLLALTGARQLRWAPPGAAMTMDFRPDRLTVAYDRQMHIERITCG